MDNLISDIFVKNKIVLSKFKTLDFSKYTKMRNYKLFYGVNTAQYHTLVFFRTAKSKFLRAELLKLDLICEKIEHELDVVIKKRILLYNSALCSKLKKSCDNWKFYDFV